MTRAERYHQLEAAMFVADRVIGLCERKVATARELRASIQAEHAALRRQMGGSDWREVTRLKAVQKGTEPP